MTTTLDLILSRAALKADAIRDRVTGGAEQVLGKKKRTKTKTIWAVGDFPYSWASEADEAAAIKSGTWFPSEKDFAAALKNSGLQGRDWQIVGSTPSFIKLIFREPKGSIERVNFVTHGASDEIGLTGTVEPGEVHFSDGLDEAELDGFRANGILNDDGSVTPWSDVQARFAPNAEIVVFACKAGIDRKFLQFLADTFGVTVKAFSNELHYVYPMADLDNGIVPRTKLTVEGVGNITSLSPNVVVTPSAPSPAPPPPGP
jgi:hypothetical protein